MMMILPVCASWLLVHSPPAWTSSSVPKKTVLSDPISRLWSTQDSSSSIANTNGGGATNEMSQVVVGVVAPLEYRGPYPCLGLKFPQLSNGKDDDAPIFYFLLDTGANINSIRLDIVQRYHVPVFARASELHLQGTSGMGGAFDPGDVYNLGNCQIHGLPLQNPPVTFLTNLTVAALPHASPVSDGLLGWTFFHLFPGGVEWDWYGTDGDPPTVQFFYTNQSEIVQQTLSGMHRLPLFTMGPTLLPMIEIRIRPPHPHPTSTNTSATTYSSLWALIDTGAPITVMTRRAAALVGIEPVQQQQLSESKLDPLQSTTSSSSSSSSGQIGDVLKVGGVDGRTIQIVRSAHRVHIQDAASNDGGSTVQFGDGYVYIGDLPGLAVMEKLRQNSSDSGPDNAISPSVVLGLDFLRRTYRMLLRLSNHEVWFENMPSDFKKNRTLRTR
jgi:hypothetical protein